MDDRTLARFMAKVEKQTEVTSPHVDTPCWLWTASTKRGYGQLKAAVREIRRRCDSGDETHTAIAREIGVSRSLVSMIARRERWSHVR